MKRLHMHVYVEDIPEAIAFYTDMFGQAPTVTKDDYAKWLIDDPAVNLAISNKGKVGLSHLGLQAGEREELTAITQRLQNAGRNFWEQKDQTCCYAVSDKTWVTDPAGINWESFHTMGASDTYYGVSGQEAEIEQAYAPAPSEPKSKERCC